jgi:hypothetical protein
LGIIENEVGFGIVENVFGFGIVENGVGLGIVEIALYVWEELRLPCTFGNS